MEMSKCYSFHSLNDYKSLLLFLSQKTTLVPKISFHRNILLYKYHFLIIKWSINGHSDLH